MFTVAILLPLFRLRKDLRGRDTRGDSPDSVGPFSLLGERWVTSGMALVDFC